MHVKKLHVPAAGIINDPAISQDAIDIQQKQFYFSGLIPKI
jgi:hypothetical protein